MWDLVWADPDKYSIMFLKWINKHVVKLRTTPEELRAMAGDEWFIEAIEARLRFGRGNRESLQELLLETRQMVVRKKLQQEALPRLARTALDGSVFVCGDFNCEPNTITTQLLTHGSTPYGTLRDRNYRAKISKAAAYYH